MQCDVQTFLRLTECASTLVTFDLESVGLNGDYNSVVVVSIKPHGYAPITLSVKQLGNDIKVVKAAKELLEKADAWVSYYGKGFDIKMLNTRLLKHGIGPIDPRPHTDMYFTLKSHLNTSRRSQAHLVNWLNLPEEKMSVSADVWATLGTDTPSKINTLIERCESDVTGLEHLYNRTKHVIRDIKR